MKLGLKIRLAMFLVAIALVASLLVWKAHASWLRIVEQREKLSAVPKESFDIVRHFQEAILGLNNTLLRYGIDHNSKDWDSFQRDSKELDEWIDKQRELPSRSDAERQCLRQIDAAYTNYVRAAEAIDVIVKASGTSKLLLNEFSAFVSASNDLLQRGYELADAHRSTLTNFLDESDRLLRDLGELLLGALILVGASGAWIALVVYRETIAPLRMKLIESRAIIERHEKLASLGMLAAGVAHEIRNPLTAVKARLFTQKKLLQPGSPEFADAEVIGQQIDRLERIVKDFLQFARPSEPQRILMTADTPLQEVVELLSPQLEKSGIHLHLEPSPPARVHIDPHQIQQVLLNLVQNASDSIGRNGTITLRARLDARRLGDRATQVVILEVQDTGKGIPPEVEKRLFDPFFSTKDGGTGLGLSIAVRIVEKHGGTLQYQTQLNVGTTFGIVLPRVQYNESKCQTPAD